MKTNICTDLVVLTLLGGLSSCNQESVSGDGGGTLNEGHVATLVAASLGNIQSTAGFAMHIERAADMASEPRVSVSRPRHTATLDIDTIFTVQKDTGLTTYRYACHSAVSLNAPYTALYTSTSAGWLEAPQVSCLDTVAADLTVSTSTHRPSSSLGLSGSFVQRGAQTFKSSKPLTIRSQIVTRWRDLTFSKTTRQILSGSGTCAVTGMSSNAMTFTWYATITFQGNQQATVVVGGRSFRIDLSRGEATPI